MPDDLREKVQSEVEDDLAKPYQQLLDDIHEELLREGEAPEESVRHALKRICSLFAKMGMDAARAQTTMIRLTWVVAGLAFATVALAVVQLLSQCGG